MAYRLKKIIVICLVLMSMGVNSAQTTAAVTPVVRVSPAAGTYDVGDKVLVEVWVDDVTDLYGADIQMTFSSYNMTVLDGDPALPGVQVTPSNDLLAPDLVIKKVVDNQLGTIWYGVTQLNPTLPASGSGILFSFEVSITRPLAGEIVIVEQTLADRNGVTIPAGVQNAAYQIPGIGKLFLPLISEALSVP
jgi:hypothetical protein